MTRPLVQIAGAILFATSLSACALPGTTASRALPATVTQKSVAPFAGGPRIYAGDAARIDVFDATAKGNPKPLYSITGSKTRLAGTAYFLYYQKSKLWVGDQNLPLLGFDSTDRGNAKPQVAISGSNTGLIEPTGVYVTGTGEIVVADYSANSISTFAPGSTGNAKPERTIAGPDTQIDGAVGLTVDPKSKKIFVVNYAVPTVLVFDLAASGDAKPLAVITGSATHLTDPIGIAIDAKGAIYVTNSVAKGNEIPAVCVFAGTAKGNAKPMRLITGKKTTLFDPLGIFVDAKGFIYTADGSGIKTFAAGANGDVAPVRTISTSGYFGVTVH